MPVIHVKLCAIYQPNGGPIDIFLSSVEAKIINCLPKKVAIFFFFLRLRLFSKYFNVAPLPELMVTQ